MAKRRKARPDEPQPPFKHPTAGSERAARLAEQRAKKKREAKQPIPSMLFTVAMIGMLMLGYGHAQEQLKPLPAKADFCVSSDVTRFKLRRLDGTASYELRASSSPVAPQNVWGSGQMPMLGKTDTADFAALGIASQVSGRDLLDNGLALKVGKSPQVIWIVYQKAK